MISPVTGSMIASPSTSVVSVTVISFRVRPDPHPPFSGQSRWLRVVCRDARRRSLTRSSRYRLVHRGRNRCPWWGGCGVRYRAVLCTMRRCGGVMAHETRAFALVAPTVHVFSRVGAGGAVTVEAGGALYGKVYPVADPIGGIDRSEGRGGSAVPERSRRPSWGESASLRRPRRAGGVVVPLLIGPQDQKFSLSK